MSAYHLPNLYFFEFLSRFIFYLCWRSRKWARGGKSFIKFWNGFENVECGRRNQLNTPTSRLPCGWRKSSCGGCAEVWGEDTKSFFCVDQLHSKLFTSHRTCRASCPRNCHAGKKSFSTELCNVSPNENERPAPKKCLETCLDHHWDFWSLSRTTSHAISNRHSETSGDSHWI